MHIIRKTMALMLSATMTISALPALSVKAAENTAPLAPRGLLTNELENPLNVEEPTFGWIVSDSDENEVQTAYEIVVTDTVTNEQVWDSQKVESSEQSYIAYSGNDLKDGHPYSWKVKTWDKDNAESPYSEESYFATGLDTSSWGATWINSGATSSNHYWYARYEKQLDSAKTIAKIMAYFAGVHDYELNVNGEYVGRGQSFDYASETRYQGWDITEFVKDNTLAVGLLNRYYGGGQGRAASQEALLGHINVLYTDGTVDEIVTNSDWKISADVPLTGSTKRNGEGDFVEEYNAQKVQNGFSTVGFDDSSWNSANVIGKHPTGDYQKVIPELSKPTDYVVHPIEVKKLSDGTTVADFGSVIPARPQITFKNGVSGRQFTIQTGYVLNDNGMINSSSAATQSTNMAYKYTQKDGEQIYNTWDHLGFRYISIPSCGEDFTTETIVAKVVHTNTPNDRESTFTSSNEMLNKVYNLMKQSAKYSIQNSFVDTPTREKGQFLQDSVNISDASTVTLYERVASKKAIEQFLASADRYWTGEESGRYNSVYPNCDGKRDIPDFTVNLPYWVYSYYMQTGDKELLKKAYPYVKATADYISKYISTSTGLVTQLAGGDGSANSYQYGIVDWPAVGRFGYDWSGTKTGARTTVNMLSKRAFDVVGYMAKELGNTADETDMISRSENIKNAINAKLINSDGVYCDGLNSSGNQVSHASQHATSYALAFDIAPSDKAETMADYIAKMGMKQGPMTADILAKALFDTNESAAALKLFTEPYDNGWAKEVDKGYTFTWESWDANSSENSQSHGWGSAAAKQMIENFAGVSVAEAGAKKIKIAPMYCALTSLNANVATERGTVGVSYERTNDNFNIMVTVPTNVTADVELPIIGDGEFKRTNGTAQSRKNYSVQTVTVGSGVYEFAYDGNITVLPEDVIYNDKPIEGIIGENDIKTNTYSWTFGESDPSSTAGTEYSDTNDYADLTVSLGKSDCLNESIKFNASSVRETNTTGQKNLGETKRYLLVKPKLDGVLNITIAFASGNNNRIYYADLGEITEGLNLSDYSKETPSNRQIAGDSIKTTASTQRTINMTAGHTYIIYTYQQDSSISEMSYKYEGKAVETEKPIQTEVPSKTETPNKTYLEIKSKSVLDDKINYTIQVNPATKGTLITSVYNSDGVLYNMSAQQVDKNNVDISANIPSKEENVDVKFMLWDGFNTMNPITDVLKDSYRPNEPTSSPTVIPTVVPLVTPSAKPTLEPTSTPTAKPTLEPTATPTVKKYGFAAYEGDNAVTDVTEQKVVPYQYDENHNNMEFYIDSSDGVSENGLLWSAPGAIDKNKPVPTRYIKYTPENDEEIVVTFRGSKWNSTSKAPRLYIVAGDNTTCMEKSYCDANGTSKTASKANTDTELTATVTAGKTYYIWPYYYNDSSVQFTVSDIKINPIAAEMTTRNIYGSNMLLQRDQPVYVDGKCTLAVKQATAKLINESTNETVREKDINIDGEEWNVTFDSVSDYANTYKLVFSADGMEDVVYTNIIFGDLYLFSGQSNMWKQVSYYKNIDSSAYGTSAVAANATDKIRVMHTQGSSDMGTAVLQYDARNAQAWRDFSTYSNVSDISAPAYTAAVKMHKETGVPIGLITNAYPGSYISSWFDSALKIDSCNLGKNGNSNERNWYCGRIYPLRNLKLSGIFWYQGEADAATTYHKNPYEYYSEMLPKLISSWRELFKNDTLPFYYVQLSRIGSTIVDENNPDTGAAGKMPIKKAQTDVYLNMEDKTNIGIISTLDLYGAYKYPATSNDANCRNDIHLGQKNIIGDRMAAYALKDIYNKDVYSHGPIYQSSEIIGNSIVVTFDCNGKLAIMPSSQYTDEVGVQKIADNEFDPNVLNEFEVAGEDGVWYSATAEITADNQVTVSSESVSTPKSVRYCGKDYPESPNLTDDSRLPSYVFEKTVGEI